jgi:RNA polymerase primary sigma factor
MYPNHDLDSDSSNVATAETLDTASLDRRLDHPAALGEELILLLCELADRDLSIGADDAPADLFPAESSRESAFTPVFGAARPLTFDDELRIAKRIEFARARLAFTLANAAVDDDVRAHYVKLTASDVARFIGKWPANLAAPDVDAIQRRWSEWLSFRNDLIEHNLALVERIALRYRTYGIPHGDLVQHGNLGLIRAADKFDWRHNVRFRTYAEWWIRQSIERATDTDRDVIHVPRPMRQKLSKAQRLNRKAGGAKLDAAKFAELMNIDKEAAAHAFSIKSGIMSLDRTADEDGHPMRHDLVGTDLGGREESEIHEHLKKRLALLLGDLPSREQNVLSMRFGLDGREPRTLEEVGEQLGISRERVRQLQARALGQLRDSVVDPRDPFAR